jgi:hypothetical protein
MNKITQYIKNSFQLVYWLVFKPISFKRKLGTLTAANNTTGSWFKYIVQTLAQTLLAIILLVVIIGFSYSHFIGVRFNWLGVSRGVTSGMAAGLLIGVMVCVIGCVALLDVQIGVTFGVTFGVAYGVVIGVVEGVMKGVENGLAIGTTEGMAYRLLYYSMGGVAIGVAIGVAFDVSLGVAFGVMFGVVLGVQEDVVLGVAVGVSSVLVVLRVHLWLPELLWIALLFGRQILSGTPPSLTLLPFYYDEKIILPLPFLEKWLIQNYDRSPNQTLQTLDYLTNHTNQQKLAAKARISIVVESLSRVQNFSQLTTIHQQFT